MSLGILARLEWTGVPHMPIKKPKSEAPQMELDLCAGSDTVHHVIDSPETVQLHYQNEFGRLYLGDSICWLKSLEPQSADMVFADPPYNLNKAEWDAFGSLKEYVEWSTIWIAQAARVLRPEGTMYVCGFSEILAHICVAAAHHFRGYRWLVWHYKNKANLGSDWGRSHESIVHFRKGGKQTFNIDNVRIPYGAHTLRYPVHPQAETSQYGKNGNGKKHDNWTPNPKGAKPKDVFDIPTTCNGMLEKTPHPTQKPEELLRRLLLASTDKGDLVLDPFSGSGTTAVVAQQLKRSWLACDNCRQYNEWAIQRLTHVTERPIEAWIQLDNETAMRREAIR